MSDWVRTSTSPSDLATAGAEAVTESQSYPGKIATIIAPGDHTWTDDAEVSPAGIVPEVPRVTDADIAEAAALLSQPGPGAMFIGGRALREEALNQAGRIAAATGARIITDTSPARLQRGAGRVVVERIPYFAEQAVEFLDGVEQIIFVGSKPPVSFFAYPDKPSWLSPDTAELLKLADARTDAEDTLRRLADALDAPAEPANVQPTREASYEEGKLNAKSAGIITAQLLPENAIVSDEGVSSGGPFYKYTSGAAKHDWMCITGGAIGQGLPLATGAASRMS